MSEHRRALDAVTGIPASAGFCEPVEGYADSPMSIVSTMRVMASEVERLNKQLAAAKEENERVRQANIHTMDVFEDMKAAKEKAEARVAELTGEVAIQNELMQQMVYTESTVDRKAIANPVALAGSALLLRKQAEAVAFVLDKLVEDQPKVSANVTGVINYYAQRLRQQADELESQSEGGE